MQPFREVLQCLTDVGFVARTGQPSSPYEAHFQGRFVSLRRRRGLDPIRLRITMYYTVDAAPLRTGWWQASLRGWVYEIRSGTDQPIYEFHWHPSSGRVTWPHLHAYGRHDSVELH